MRRPPSYHGICAVHVAIYLARGHVGRQEAAGKGDCGTICAAQGSLAPEDCPPEWPDQEALRRLVSLLWRVSRHCKHPPVDLEAPVEGETDLSSSQPTTPRY